MYVRGPRDVASAGWNRSMWGGGCWVVWRVCVVKPPTVVGLVMLLLRSGRLDVDVGPGPGSRLERLVVGSGLVFGNTSVLMLKHKEIRRNGTFIGFGGFHGRRRAGWEAKQGRSGLGVRCRASVGTSARFERCRIVSRPFVTAVRGRASPALGARHLYVARCLPPRTSFPRRGLVACSAGGCLPAFGIGVSRHRNTKSASGLAGTSSQIPPARPRLAAVAVGSDGSRVA
jgi:hypothetical protein